MQISRAELQAAEQHGPRYHIFRVYLPTAPGACSPAPNLNPPPPRPAPPRPPASPLGLVCCVSLGGGAPLARLLRFLRRRSSSQLQAVRVQPCEGLTGTLSEAQPCEAPLGPARHPCWALPLDGREGGLWAACASRAPLSSSSRLPPPLPPPSPPLKNLIPSTPPSPPLFTLRSGDVGGGGGGGGCAGGAGD